jgi:hypothetical protein
MTTFAIEAYLSGSWVDITNDVRGQSSVIFRHGIAGSGVTDRVAQTGTLSFLLDNSARNSGSKLGYYSPDHANARAGWDIGTMVRYSILDSAATAYYKFYGKVSQIEPAPGLYRERYVSVTALDFMTGVLGSGAGGVAWGGPGAMAERCGAVGRFYSGL